MPSLLASSPWVRLAKVAEASGFSGEWVDFDHVYTFIHRGQADFIFDGMRLRAGPGTALVMPPGVRHLVRSSRPGQTVVQQIVHFDLTWDAVRARQLRIGSLPQTGRRGVAHALACRCPCRDGLSYLHAHSTAAAADSHGVLIESVEKTARLG